MAECLSCGASLTSSQKFCRVCGAERDHAEPLAAPSGDRSCNQCGERLPPTAGFCRRCGAPGAEFADHANNLTTPVRRTRTPRSAWLILALAVALGLALSGAYIRWLV